MIFALAFHCATVAVGCALKISKKKSTDIKSDDNDDEDGEGVKDDEGRQGRVVASCQRCCRRDNARCRH